MATIKSFTDKPKRKPYFKHNVVYCKSGDIVITYPNVLAAEAATGIYSDRIYKCCNGKKGFTGGFAWSYTPFEEYPDDGRIWKDVEGYENLYQVLQASKTSGDSYMVINRQLKTGIITKNAIHIWKQV